MWEPEEPLKTFYEMSKGEWQPDGCGELPLWQCDPVLKVRVCFLPRSPHCPQPRDYRDDM